MLRSRAAITVGILCVVSFTAINVHVARAQSAQPVSIQVSVLGTTIGVGTSSNTGGIGIEPQFRFNRVARSESMGTVSLGIGGQWTRHASGPDELTIAGGFVEPRWVPPVSFADGRVFVYLAARLAVLNQSNNFGSSSSGAAYGGGGGLAIVLNRQLNLDLGAALVRQSFSDFKYTDGSAGSFRTFSAYAVKAGFSYGIGK